MSRHPSRPRTSTAQVGAGDSVALAVLAGAGPLLLGASTMLSHATPGGADASLARALALGAALVGAGLVLWWGVGLLGLAITSLGHRLGSRRAVALGGLLTPALLRRAAAAVLGAQLLAAPAALADASGPASSAGSPVSASWTTPSVPAASPPSAAWTPRTPSSPPPGTTAAPRPTDERPTVTVRRGDCLWDIAERELGPDATPREIDRRWRDWHRENADVIGEDPSLLHTGTVLVAPVFSPHVPVPLGTTP